MPAAAQPLLTRLLALGLPLLIAFLTLGAPARAGEAAGALDDEPASRFRASLSGEERAWLAGHPILSAGNGPDFQPFYAWQGNGQYGGPSADYLDLLGRRTGLRFRMRRFADFPATLRALREGRIDLIPTLTPTEARRKDLLFTGGYLHSPAIVVTRSGSAAPALPASFEGLRIAIETGHASAEVLRRTRPAALFVEFPDTAAALQAVASGEADAYVGMLAVAHYYLEQLGLSNLQVRQRFDADLSAMAIAVSRDTPLLHAILRKAMLFVSDAEGNALARRYLPAGTGIPGETFRLSGAEQAWLRSHGPVRMGYDQAFYPLSYTNSKHQAEGYSVELFRLLRDKAGLAVDESAGAWATVLKKTTGRELDVLVAVAATPARRDELILVGPYLSSPTVIVTRNDFQQAWDLADFAGRKLALLEEHFLAPRIRSAYPSIQLLEVPAQEDALRLVAAGAADVAIGNLYAVNRLIQSKFLGKLYIAGHVPDADSELYMGVSRAAPELAAILRRALDAVAPAEIASARNRWLDTRYTPAEPAGEIGRLVWPPLAALASLIVVSAYWRRRLAREKAARRAAFATPLARLAEIRQALATGRPAPSAGLLEELRRNGEQLERLAADRAD